MRSLVRATCVFVLLAVSVLAQTAAMPAAVNEPQWSAILPEKNMLYVSAKGSPVLLVVDLAHNVVAAAVTLPGPAEGVAVSATASEIYAAIPDQNIVVVIDATTNKISGTIETGQRPIAIAVDEKAHKLFVNCALDGAVVVLDTVKKSRVDTVFIGKTLTRIAFDPATGRVYTSNWQEGTVTVINGATAQVMATIPVGSDPWGIAIDSSRSRIYVARQDGNALAVINSETNTKIKDIAVGHFPLNVVVDPESHHVYVASTGERMLYSVDSETGEVLAKIEVGRQPVGLAMHAGRARLYVVNKGEATISVVRPSRDAVVGSVRLNPPAPLPPLYAGSGPTVGSVKQLRLGSCYLHSTLAAVAGVNPRLVNSWISANPDGSYLVKFVDGTKETVYPDDLRFLTEHEFDRSDGLWVKVMIRAYAQKTLRVSLLAALENLPILLAPIKSYAVDLVKNNDGALIAYDRAIRGAVSQTGELDKDKLKSALLTELDPLPIDDKVKDSLMLLLESNRFFDLLEASVKENGEIFGAYRAIGNGGVPGRAMVTLLGGKFKYIETDKPGEMDAALTAAVRAHLPIVTATFGSEPGMVKFRNVQPPSDAANWYVGAHAYTVLGYDPASRMVTLRNPWGDHPDPDGIFKLPLDVFTSIFETTYIADPEGTGGGQ